MKISTAQVEVLHNLFKQRIAALMWPGLYFRGLGNEDIRKGTRKVLLDLGLIRAGERHYSPHYLLTEAGLKAILPWAQQQLRTELGGLKTRLDIDMGMQRENDRRMSTAMHLLDDLQMEVQFLAG